MPQRALRQVPVALPTALNCGDATILEIHEGRCRIPPLFGEAGILQSLIDPLRSAPTLSHLLRSHPQEDPTFDYGCLDVLRPRTSPDSILALGIAFACLLRLSLTWVRELEQNGRTLEAKRRKMSF